jgi:hypothetical protein
MSPETEETTMTDTERIIAETYDASPDDYRAEVYWPGESRIGEATPQTNPALFSDAEILAEVKYLMRMNKRLGSHPLRTAAYMRLMRVLEERKDETQV